MTELLKTIRVIELPFTGTAAALLKSLHESARDRRQLPATARELSAALKDCALNLQLAGVHVSWGKKTNRGRLITIERVPGHSTPVPPPTAAPVLPALPARPPIPEGRPPEKAVPTVEIGNPFTLNGWLQRLRAASSHDEAERIFRDFDRLPWTSEERAEMMRHRRRARYGTSLSNEADW